MSKAKTEQSLLDSKGVSPPLLASAGYSETGKCMRELYGGKREGIGRALIGGRWHREAGVRIVRSRTGYAIGYRSIFGFRWLVLSEKQGQKLRKLLLIDPILAILGQCYRSYCLTSWIVTGDRSLLPASLTYSRLASWLVIVVQGLVSWADCCRWWRKVLLSCMWSGCCLFAYSVLHFLKLMFLKRGLRNILTAWKVGILFRSWFRRLRKEEFIGKVGKYEHHLDILCIL